MNCPRCSGTDIIKNGHTNYGKQRFKCRNCGRQFVDSPSRQPIPQSSRDLIDKLLLERLSLAAIVRITGVSERWLQYYVNQKYYQTPKQVEVTSKKLGKLTIQLDEMHSFVGKKDNKQWIWLAIDVDTREIVGVFIGECAARTLRERSRQGAEGLWQSLPPVYRQCAICYTDFWEAYEQVLPSMRHRAVGKESGLTNYIERLNNTISQRIGRLVRKTLSFSKKLSNHIGKARVCAACAQRVAGTTSGISACRAVWYFVHHYNAALSG